MDREVRQVVEHDAGAVEPRGRVCEDERDGRGLEIP
jgi:hypothetical protein